MFHHWTSSTNHITNRSVWVEFYWSIEVTCIECFIIEHILQITLEINHIKESSVKVSKWGRDNVSSWNIPYKSHHRTIRLTRVLLQYWGELEARVQHRISLTNRTTNQSVLAKIFWSIEVGLRQCFIIGHPLQITLQINQSHESTVEVSRWIRDNISSLKISDKSQ